MPDKNLRFVNFFLGLVGQEKDICPRCGGTGIQRVGSWCWPCQGHGFQTYPKKKGPVY